MNANALRTWGMVVSAAAMTGALALSWRAPPRASAEAPLNGGKAAYEMAQAPQAHAAPVGFLVRFRGTGPIARAQAQAARGQTAQAQRRIELELNRQRAFTGLCFDRFTTGAAEIVLRSCQPVAASERAAYQQRWTARLRAMRAVAYVDANATVTPESAPG
jgi:hypothetical protein